MAYLDIATAVGGEKPTGSSAGDSPGASPDSCVRSKRRQTSIIGPVILRRVLLAIPLIFVVTAFSFLLVSVTPGDAAREILGTDATPATYANMRAQLGLDQPVYVQYADWLANALKGDLGTSIFSGQSVTEAIQSRLPVTLSLVACSLLVSLIVGVGLGVFSAVRGGPVARIVDGLALIGFALPSVWVGAILIGLFAVKLSWLPATGYIGFTASPGGWARSLVLPVTALAMHAVAAVSKQTREAMMDVLHSDFVRMARANGVSERSLVFRHSLKNASMRVVTVLGLQAIGLLGGTVLVESVFALPGLGGLAVDAARRHDLPVIQGVVLTFTVLVVVVNLIIDIVYTWLNPRVSAQ